VFLKLLLYCIEAGLADLALLKFKSKSLKVLLVLNQVIYC